MYPTKKLPQILTKDDFFIWKIKTQNYLSDGDFAIVDQWKSLIGGYSNEKDLVYTGKLPVIIYGDHTNVVKYIDFPFIWWADGIKVFSFQKDIDTKYAFYLLEHFKPETQGYRRHYSLLKDIDLPLPPLSTQSHIVARLDSAFASIDEQISLLRANIADVENMRKSVLEESFQSGEYEVKKLWDIFDVRDGTHDSPKFHTTGYPLITSKNLSENGIDFGNIKLISEEDYEKINQRSKVDKWDLLFAMIGTIGTPTIVDIEPEFAIKNVALFKPKNTDADMRYLRYFLLSDFVIQKMLTESKWATQKFVGLGYLRAFQFPLPPLPRQHEIVAHLDRVFATTGLLRGEYEAQIRDLETLKQSLLEEAFAGRLVTDEI